DYSNKPVYVYGLSASFTNTIVYYTDVQLVDSIRLDKNGLLPYRDIYSYQLKSYLEDTRHLTNRTCITYFSISKNKLEKEQNKVLNRYNKDKSVTVSKIEPAEFSYKKPE
ncbi:MAG: hypothetical protein LUD15_01995, partial [Bacteroides sp.]|nr:hypothetical protein [Bacteroides sp.]